MRTGLTVFLLLFCGIALSSEAQSQAGPRPRAQAGSRRTAPAAAEPADQYKGIFEPVNYGQDINLTDVFFVSPDVGWVSGEHATILKTTDAGAHWTAQVGGDPNGTEKAIGQLRFLDARHGWAVTDDQRLLRTMDGENWEQIGQQPAPGSGFVDYAFTSVRHGIALGGNMGGFYVTNDGGRRWVNVTPCKVHATVQGLPRTEDCRVKKLQMLSSRSGYASAEWSGGIVFLRTDDGGEHWTSIVNDVSTGWPDFFFTDVNHGVMVSNNGKTYLTDDGAKTWHALLSGSVGIGWGQGRMAIQFADPEVGWVIGASPDNSRTYRVSFSTDGGRHWKISQSNINFPVESDRLRFNVVRRDRAYVIGDHGMIYRYRVVPANYRAANAFDGPLMPAFGGMELSVKADAIRRDIAALESKLAPLDSGGQSPEASSPVGQSSNAGSSAGSSASAAGQPLPDDGRSRAASSDTAGASGGFTQQTDVSATADAVVSSNANITTPAAITQDPSPTSDVLANCCAAAVQQLQTDTAGFVAQVPQVTSQYRPLNLIIAGLQLAATLMNQSQSLWGQFKSLKHSPNIQTASAALQQLSTTLAAIQQASSSGVQTPGTWFAANAPTAFTQDVGTAALGTGAVVTQTSTPENAKQAPGAQTKGSGDDQQQNPAQNTVDQTLNGAKQKIKNKLKWPKL